jgi:signal peptidase II
MARGTRLLVLLVLITGCVGCDQVTKAVARSHLVPGETISLLADTLRLQHTENPGAFMSLGDSLPQSLRTALFTVGGMVLVLASIGWALFSRHLRWTGLIGAALICGGGIGNLIDRLGQQGHVTDFLNVGLGGLRTGIFNVADFILMLGLALSLYAGMTEQD